VTADSPTVVAVLTVLQAAGGILYFRAKVKPSFATNAAASALVFLIRCSTWSQVDGSGIALLIAEALLLLLAIAGATSPIRPSLWWLNWIANLLILLMLAYLTFLFHIF
jgi:hypothetical protein